MEREDLYRQVGLPSELATEENAPPASLEAPFDANAPMSKTPDGEVVVPHGIGRMHIVKVSEAPVPPRREYILEDLVPEGAATTVYGDGGVAKSLLAMSLCVSVAGGRPMWMGRQVKNYACLYLDFELTADEQVRRVKGLCRGEGMGEAVPDELYYASALGLPSGDAFWRAYEVAEEYGIGLLVVDSLGLALQGEAENAGDVIAFYRQRLEPFVREGIAILLVDHQAKGGDSYQRRTAFGSVYKRNLVRSEIQIEALEQDEESGTLDLVFRHTKHNFGPRMRPFGARVGFQADEIQVGPTPLDKGRMMVEEGVRATDRVLMALEDLESATAREIAERTNMNLGTARRVAEGLRARGKVRVIGTGQNRLDIYALVRHMPDVPGPMEEESDEELIF